MSPAVPAMPPGTVDNDPAAGIEEIRVYGHSNLFYWWPVWVVGFLMAGLTYLDGHVMAIVPAGTQIEQTQVVPGSGGQPREVLVPPAGQAVPAAKKDGDQSPRLLVAANNNYGVIFAGTILVIVMITNFTLRGLASVIAVAAIVILGLFFALMGWWDSILAFFGGLDIRMNAGGYLAIALPLFLVWVFATFVYDRYVYLIVSRGQIRIRQDIGDGEVAVDTNSVVLEKKRNDLFRHWVLGFGSGDLHVKTGGPANLDFELNNVLFIGSRLDRIQDLLREREMAPQGPAT
jgi:hypothetical protein